MIIFLGGIICLFENVLNVKGEKRSWLFFEVKIYKLFWMVLIGNVSSVCRVWFNFNISLGGSMVKVGKW